AKRLLERQTPLELLLELVLDPAVESREEHLDAVVEHLRLLEEEPERCSFPVRGPNRLGEPRLAHGTRCEQRSAVAGAFHRRRPAAGRPRLHVGERELELVADSAAHAEPPGARIDGRDVVVREQVVETDRRHVVAKRLERHAVVARGQLELLARDVDRRREGRGSFVRMSCARLDDGQGTRPGRAGRLKARFGTVRSHAVRSRCTWMRGRRFRAGDVARRTTAVLLVVLAAAMFSAVARAAKAATATWQRAAVTTTALQRIDGFGASGAWWPNDVVDFTPAAQEQIGALLFGRAGIALSSYRFNIGAGGSLSDPVRETQSFLVRPGGWDWPRDPGGM